MERAFFESEQCFSVCCGTLWEYRHWLELKSLVCDLGLAVEYLRKRCIFSLSTASLNEQTLDPSEYCHKKWDGFEFCFRAKARK